ncbi:hypothetical protein [Frisingicoccus sp.]
MMISPEAYYEYELKGKTEQELRKEIRSLKNQIGHLKKIIECPRYEEVEYISPSAKTQLSCNRMYLDYAKQALNEVGGEYFPSQAEKRVLQFQEDIEHINKMMFQIPEDDSLRVFEVEVLEEDVKVYECKRLKATEIATLDKTFFYSSLKELYIGEWQRYYNPERIGLEMIDYQSWWIDFRFDNERRRVSIGGNNYYPYNFDEFIEIFRIDNTKTDL